MRTELGRSQVEVQRCALSWEGPRLRSRGAHWAGKLAKSLAKVGKAEVEVEVDADMVEEKQEEAEEKEEEEEDEEEEEEEEEAEEDS